MDTNWVLIGQGELCVFFPNDESAVFPSETPSIQSLIDLIDIVSGMATFHDIDIVDDVMNNNLHGKWKRYAAMSVDI